MTETPRQKFLRNHYENVRIMRAAAKRESDAGNQDTADQITRIADEWDKMGEVAETEERNQADDTLEP